MVSKVLVFVVYGLLVVYVFVLWFVYVLVLGERLQSFDDWGVRIWFARIWWLVVGCQPVRESFCDCCDFS